MRQPFRDANTRRVGSFLQRVHSDVAATESECSARDWTAGRDCTCSFTEAVATVCYSLGSSRRVQLRAAPCKHRKKCCA